MIPKISLVAAFFLMVAPPMACASNSVAANPAPIMRQAHRSPVGIVVAQDQSSAGVTNNDSDSDSDSNDSDTNDSADDNQNGDASQMDPQNGAGDDQPVPPTVLNGNENDQDNAPQFNPVPPQMVNPNQ
jgi:hypothetical protein